MKIKIFAGEGSTLAQATAFAEKEFNGWIAANKDDVRVTQVMPAQSASAVIRSSGFPADRVSSYSLTVLYEEQVAL